MSHPITLHFTPKKEDYANVLRLFSWRRTSTRISLGFLVIIFGMVIFFLFARRSSPTIIELAWLLTPLIIAGYVYLVQPSRIARQAAQVERLVADTTWHVSDSGIQITTCFGSTSLEWGMFQRMISSRDYYLLLDKGDQIRFQFLPRRAFQSAQEQSLFLELVDRNLLHPGSK